MPISSRRRSRRGGSAEIVRVRPPGAVRGGTQSGQFDVILADYNLPAFDGVPRRCWREVPSEVPFIFLSGTSAKSSPSSG